MSTKTPSELEADETAQNRAQAEQFAFDVDAPGFVEITNESYANPADHQSVISIDGVSPELMIYTCLHTSTIFYFCNQTPTIEYWYSCIVL
jgi:hypothetical protein